MSTKEINYLHVANEIYAISQGCFNAGGEDVTYEVAQKLIIFLGKEPDISITELSGGKDALPQL